jgi:uncharacterized protein (TIGR03663 family)
MLSGSRCLSLAIIALAFVLRVAWLDAKPAHFDEGVNGWFVDQMKHQGYYAYDPTNFHGPLHYYGLFVSQTLFGRNLWALRMPLVLISTACVALVFAFRRHLGTTACHLGALAMAVSPGFVFYGRYAIHESEFVFFLMLATWGFAGLLSYHGPPARDPPGRHAACGLHLWAAALGMTGVVLTKETYVVHFAAFAVAALCVCPRNGAANLPRVYDIRQIALVATVCLGLIVFFYSGGFLHWESLPGLWLTFAPWLATGMSGESGHEKDWWYWLQLLSRYEWPALLGLLAAPWLAWRAGLVRGLAVLSIATLGVYSAIAYKTPWCLISLMWPWHLLFGVAVVRIYRELDRWLAILITLVPLTVSLLLSLDLNFRKCTDETEPYVYVQTLPAIEKVLGPLRTLVARDPLQRHLVGHVVMADIHPLPWLLGDFTHIDFPMFDDLPETLDAPFLLIDEELAETIEPHLHQTYFREPLQLRGQAEGTALLYLRVAEFRDFFPGRVAEFVPENTPP